MRPTRRLSGWLSAALTLAGLVSACTPGELRRPDILMITIDTLRADHLGAYGHAEARTPIVDELARRGRLFTRAYTPFPRTTPALGSLLSGLWPSRHGSREVSQRLGPDVVLLSGMLRDAGYATLGVSANGAAGASQHFDRGFDLFRGRPELRTGRADSVTRLALDSLAELPDDRPNFVWLHYIDPHFPYRPARSWPDQPAAPTCRELMVAIGGDRSQTAHVVNNLGGRSERALADCRALYDAEIAFTDHQLGALFAGLRDQGRLQEALVVVTSDHGENLGEWGLYFQHGPNLHDASLRVPLILAGAGIPPGVDDGAIRLLDVAPTLLGWLDIPAPAMDGRDLSGRFSPWRRPLTRQPTVFAESGSALLVESFRYPVSGRSGGRNCTNGVRFALCKDEDGEMRLYDHVEDPDLTRDVSAEHPRELRTLAGVRRRWPPESARQRSVRQGRYKLVEVPQLEGGYRSRLFDLEADPGETRDLAEERPGLARRLQNSLDDWTATLPAPNAGQLSDEEIETLRALGYIN